MTSTTKTADTATRATTVNLPTYTTVERSLALVNTVALGVVLAASVWFVVTRPVGYRSIAAVLAGLMFLWLAAMTFEDRLTQSVTWTDDNAASLADQTWHFDALATDETAQIIQSTFAARSVTATDDGDWLIETADGDIVTGTILLTGTPSLHGAPAIVEVHRREFLTAA